jgi:hypothetical protein
MSDVQDTVYEGIVNHNENLTFKFNGDKREFYKGISKSINKAMNKDVYYALLCDGFNIKTEYKGDNEITANVALSFNETKEQSECADNILKRIEQDIFTDGMSDYDKVLAADQYLRQNLTYDEALKNRLPYESLITGKTVCQGYAMLMYRLLNDSGVDCKIVIGYLSGVGHSWNKVKLDGNWYNVDTTNNDANNSDIFLLKSDKTMKKNGFIEEGDYPQAVADYAGTIVHSNKQSTSLKDLLKDMNIDVTKYSSQDTKNDQQVSKTSDKEQDEFSDYQRSRQKQIDDKIKDLMDSINEYFNDCFDDYWLAV